LTSQRVVRDALSRLGRRGIRPPSIEHVTDPLPYRLDEVVWIEHGRVLDRGPHEELIGRTPAYALLVNAYDDEAERRAGLVATEEAAR
jgi:hypothetical protein